MNPVLFYSHNNGEYRAFSNWFPAPFVLDGVRFANSEQAMMFFKSNDPVYRNQVKKTPRPADVKKLGRTVKLRPDWDQVKYGIVVRILEAKFTQNDDLKELLLSTEDRKIHEDCEDPWWGGGPNHRGGRDLLGKALMEVREKLREVHARSAST